MEYFFQPLSREESADWVKRMQGHLAEYGFCHYPVELKENHALIGAVGLSVPSYKTLFSPCVEIGWRLAPAYWNRGLVTEAAWEVLRHAFDTLRLREIVAFTVPANLRSQRVMEKIGLVRDLAGDFDHPRIPLGHPLQRHVLYRRRNPNF